MSICCNPCSPNVLTAGYCNIIKGGGNIITHKIKKSTKDGVIYNITIYKDGVKIMSIDTAINNEDLAVKNAIKLFKVYVSLTKTIRQQESLYNCQVVTVYGE